MLLSANSSISSQLHTFCCFTVGLYVHFYLFICAVTVEFQSASLQKHTGIFQNQRFFRNVKMNYKIPAELESLKI